MKQLTSLFLFLVFSLSAWAYDRVALEATIREGDIIFQETEGPLTAALVEATETPWTHVGTIFRENGRWVVAEASKKVMKTPLHDFIQHGPGSRFVVKRVGNRSFNAQEMRSLKAEHNEMMNKAYDAKFQWSDAKIYCSELVYKAYDAALGIRIGRMEVMGDLRLEGPAAQALIEKMFTSQGEEFNYQEPVVTPISMMQSEILENVFENLAVNP